MLQEALKLSEAHAENQPPKTSLLSVDVSGFSVESKLDLKIKLSRLPLLYIDDSLNDRILVQEAARRQQNRFDLHTVDSLDAAMPYFRPHHHADANSHPRPALILLDYDLGMHTGADFLYWLRIQMGIKKIPVIMYSGSVGMRHVALCYAAGANHFLRKPKSFANIKAVIHSLDFCMASDPPHFRPLKAVVEYVPDPRAHLPARVFA